VPAGVPSPTNPAPQSRQRRSQFGSILSEMVHTRTGRSNSGLPSACAKLGADLLHFIVVTCVRLVRQSRRPIRLELIASVQCERSDISPTGRISWCEPRAPLAGSGGTGFGVGCQSPGCVPGVYGVKSVAWSVARRARIATAAACPTATPSSFEVPSGTAAKAMAYAVLTSATAAA
jgi:hypothetical protein